MVVDKMHMKGHVDKWCKQNCDAKTFPELDKVHNIIHSPGEEQISTTSHLNKLQPVLSQIYDYGPLSVNLLID